MLWFAIFYVNIVWFLIWNEKDQWNMKFKNEKVVCESKNKIETQVKFNELRVRDKKLGYHERLQSSTTVFSRR